MSIRPELRRELLTLPADERQELADELYESVARESMDPDWQQAWSGEIEHRFEEVIEGRVELIDADDVHAALDTDEQHVER